MKGIPSPWLAVVQWYVIQKVFYMFLFYDSIIELPLTLVIQLHHAPANEPSATSNRPVHSPTPDMSARSQLQPLACWNDLPLWDVDIQNPGKHWKFAPAFRSLSSPPYRLKPSLGTPRCARPAACVDPLLPLDLDFGEHTTAQYRCENPGSDKYAVCSGAADGPHTDSRERKSKGPSFWTSGWDRCFPSPAPQTTGALASNVSCKKKRSSFLDRQKVSKRSNKTKGVFI